MALSFSFSLICNSRWYEQKSNIKSTRTYKQTTEASIVPVPGNMLVATHPLRIENWIFYREPTEGGPGKVCQRLLLFRFSMTFLQTSTFETANLNHNDIFEGFWWGTWSQKGCKTFLDVPIPRPEVCINERYDVFPLFCVYSKLLIAQQEGFPGGIAGTD